ncbi:MAG: xylanase [Bacteroidaceae bacterium]|nr:xylanase [Bacteroidaceae bacterium]
MKASLLSILAMFLALTASAQGTLLADFENGGTGKLRIGTDYAASLFKVTPKVMTNPDKTGINTSNRCVGATNVANAGWWQNFLVLELKTPVVIKDDNCFLSMLAYRSIQPKDMRIGINGYGDTEQIFQGKLSQDATWQELTFDLEAFYGQRLQKIYIILSCNWSDPSSGWGEATYCFDDIRLSGAEPLPDASVSIDTSKCYQTIQDFGASDCWTTEFIGDYYSTTQKAKAAKWLFSQQMDKNGNPEGIGLSCWRVNIGAGSATQGEDSNIAEEIHRTECFLNQDGTYDWTRQDGQQWFMRQAKEYGVEHFLFFSNSPPIYYTKNGKANANNQNITCNLKTTCYDDFAEFLATVTKHFVDEGYNVTYIDPVNEPQYDWKSGQEGSPWENSDITKLAKQLDKSIASRGLDTKILIPEAGSLTCLYAGTSARGNKQIEAFWKRTNSSTYIGNLKSLAPVAAAHSYWTVSSDELLREVREKVRNEAAKYGVQVMQTEWSMLDDPPSTSAGFPASYAEASKMSIALFMGKLIQCDLTIGNMVGWSYWTAFSQEKWGHKNRFHLIRVNTKGDTGEESTGDLKQGGTLTADKNLWVLGNFSRFIRPGYKRIELESSETDDGRLLLGSAWLSPDENEVVTVLVNLSHARRKVDLSMVSGEASEVRTYVTDRSRDLKLDTSLQDLHNLELPARSVVTVVIGLEDATGIGNEEFRIKSEESDNVIYDLSGRKIVNDKLSKGIYIIDGRKIAK